MAGSVSLLTGHRLAALAADEQTPEKRRGLRPFGRIERRQERVVDRQDGAECFLGGPLASFREAHQYATPVTWIRHALDQAGARQAVETRSHRARGDQRGPSELPGIRPIRVSTSAECVHDVEVTEAQAERLQRGGQRLLQVPRAEKQPADHFQRAGVQLRIAGGPRADDLVDRV
jgi:hypothetical protein